MRSILAVAALACAVSTAAAEDAASDPVVALKAALAAAERQGAARYAFTLVQTDLAAENPRAYVVRFDPRLPAGDSWVAVDPPFEALDPEQKRKLEALQKAEADADGALVYDGLAQAADEARLLSATDEFAVFEAPPPRDIDAPEAARKALKMQLVLDRRGGFISEVRITTDRAFKPNPAAKVERLDQTLRYAPRAEGGAALLVSAESEIEGEAAFRKFRQHVRNEYRDVEAVDAPPRPSTAED